MCQRPKRALFISTEKQKEIEKEIKQGVNALNGLSSFLLGALMCAYVTLVCVNALNGLSSFLRYPLKPRINTGFPASFLQVFA